GMLTTGQEELRHPDSSIIIMAYTNRAVDEICTKLIEKSIEFIRLGNDMSCAPPSRPYLLSSKVRNISKASELAAEINRHRVFVATTTALNANPALFRLKQFSLGVIDEASQILEPQLLGILSARTASGADAISRFVLIGDHKQLPAIVQQTPGESAVDEECLHEIGLHDCRLSLFERLAVRYSSDPTVCHMLTTQGRMHRSIAAFASRNFYSDKLREVPLPHQTAELADSPADATVLRRLIDSHRMLFFDVHDTDTGLADKVNHSEARLIGAIIQEIYRKEGSEFDAADTVGVIVPYRNQIAAIRSELAACGIPGLNDICIDTVERYQGSQRKYIIYGFTVRKYYQLQFLTSHVFEDTDGMIIDRKLNVALTRAREYMIMTGDSILLRRNAVFSRLISHIESCGGFVTDMPPASENS
ncbi:MAG: DNA2/NAM7 family helicase, partial [Muribaculaceae bacterium]|nr:DNA2/NAM7 family helicase [Muribaculaceae bacterium]